jgi:hypothetical protein
MAIFADQNQEKDAIRNEHKYMIPLVLKPETWKISESMLLSPILLRLNPNPC